MPARLLRFLASGAACLALAFLSGCATASNPTPLSASEFAPQHKHTGAVSVTATGGSETSSVGASQISNAAIVESVTQTIQQSGLFEQVAAQGTPYRLEIQLVRLEQPMFGGTFTVKLEMNWRLLDTSGTPVWQKAVQSAGTATMGDAFAGVTRLRLANENALRLNIRDALTQIGALDLKR